MIAGIRKLLQNEFWFVPYSLSRSVIGVRLRSRTSDFCANIRLRRKTSDARVFHQVFLDRDYDLSSLGRHDIQQNYQKLLSEGKTPLILDIGANIGAASLYFAKDWPEARILAVEPEPENHWFMLQNVRNHPRIETLRAAVASCDSMVTIVDPGAEKWAYRTQISDGHGAEAIPAFSVRGLIEHASKNGIVSPFIIKIDIEGFEENLFSRNLDWISQFHVIIIELHDWMLPKRAVSNSFLRAISQHRRDFLFRGENVISLAN